MADMKIEEILFDEREEEDTEEEEVEEVTIEGKKKGKDKTKKKSRNRKLNKYIEEWIQILLGSSSSISTNDHTFKDSYFLCRDVNHPCTNGHNLIMYFY